MHADALRNTFGTTDAISGHDMSYWYRVGSLESSTQESLRFTMNAREIDLLSRDVALDHIEDFVGTLRMMP